MDVWCIKQLVFLLCHMHSEVSEFICVATEKDRQMMTLVVASAGSTCSPFVWHFVQDVWREGPCQTRAFRCHSSGCWVRLTSTDSSHDCWMHVYHNLQSLLNYEWWAKYYFESSNHTALPWGKRSLAMTIHYDTVLVCCTLYHRLFRTTSHIIVTCMHMLQTVGHRVFPIVRKFAGGL